MISHYYQCDKCGLRVPIVWTGWPDQTEVRDRLPEGWALVFHKSENRSYCENCWTQMYGRTHGY